MVVGGDIVAGVILKPRLGGAGADENAAFAVAESSEHDWHRLANLDESNVTVTAAATSMVLDAFEAAILQGRLVDLSIYQFNSDSGNDSPQTSQQLVAGYTGQVTGGAATLTSLTLQLGSALAPVGAQVPPRKFTTAIMGQGIRE